MSMRGNPFEELERMFERMSRQFEEAARSWEGQLPRLAGAGWGTMGIDLADHGDEFVVTADVPGFEKDEIDLELRDDTLHVHAEHAEEHEETAGGEEAEGTYIRSERSHRRMSDSIRLPEPVDADAVSATCKNGVLTVHLPKREPSEPAHHIDVE